MHDAAKRKTPMPASLAAVRLLLLLVVAFCGLETRVWSFAPAPPTASGEIALTTPAFIGENYDAVAYDASDSLVAAKTAETFPGKLYHYTGAGNAESILQNGLGAGGRRTFATPAGNLSPVQAQIELALPANRGYPGALFEINTARLQQLGINPAVGPQRIMSTPNAGGGGIEFIFNQPIPPSAIRQVPFP